MTWNTQIINDNVVDITVNGTRVASGAQLTLQGVGDITVTVGGTGIFHLTEPGADDFHKYIGTTWAIKVIAADFVRYWGYEGGPTVVVRVHDDRTFSLPDQTASFSRVPIHGPALAQYAGVFTTNTDFWGNTFSPMTFNVDGSISVGSGSTIVNIEPTYDSRNSNVQLEWTTFGTTSFTTSFTVSGTGSNLSLSGGLTPRPVDGPVHMGGTLQSRTPFTAQASRLHDFILRYEAPLYFDSQPSTPLTFAGAAALIRGSTSTPDLFRIFAVDISDATKGYHLRCNGMYVSKELGTYNGATSVPGTRTITSAVVFQPVFLSSKTFKLMAPGYVNPVPGSRAITNPALSCSNGSSVIAICADNTTGFQTTVRIPFSGLAIPTRRAMDQKLRLFFGIPMSFPLVLQNSLSLEFSGDRPTPHLIPLGNPVPFIFTPVDPADISQGYRIVGRGFYVAGMGSIGQFSCLNLSSNIADAAIFEIKVLSPTTFMIRNTTTWQVLTQPIDPNIDGRTNPRPVIIYGTAGDNSGFTGVNQVFVLPAWVSRVTQMGYLPQSLEFSLQVPDDTKIVYVDSNGTLQLSASVTDSASAVVTVVPQDASKTHAGYLMVIGGTKYVQFRNVNTPVVLVADITQASPLCIINHSDESISLWVCQTNYVLTVSGTSVVFTSLDDANAMEPRWNITPPPMSHPHMSTLSAGDPLPTSLDDTVHIKYIVNMMMQNLERSRKTVWDVSFNNTLPTDWLISTPKGAFGNYDDMEMAIADLNATNDFGLKAQTPGEPMNPRHPAVALASSVKAPGQQPLVLHAGHSRAVYEQIYQVMITGRKIIDILGLGDGAGMPSGQFLAAVRNAITYLSNIPEAQNVIIRFLIGMPLGHLGQSGSPEGTGPYWTATQVLQKLVRDVQSSSSKIQVYVGYQTMAAAVQWSHAKIVAVDGQIALVGGHNMWDGAYLWANPVLDVTMKVTGLAAVDAHHFADMMWRDQVSAPDEKLDADMPSFFTYIASFQMPRKVFKRETVAVPPELLYNSIFPEAAHAAGRDSGTGIPVLSVGRVNGIPLDKAPSDKAFIWLVDSATTSIHISGQALRSHYKPFRYWWDDFLAALARALVRSVRVKIFLSDATVKGAYSGDLPVDVVTEIRNKLVNIPDSGLPAILARLSVQSFPPATRWGFPATFYGCSNHAKIIAVDSRAVSIGSQNFYPSWPATMAEFTYIFESMTIATQLMTSYFTPLESWCSPPPPAPASARPSNFTYTITLKSLVYYNHTSTWSIYDQVYLMNKGARFWPVSVKFQDMKEDETKTINLTLPSFKDSDAVQIVEVWDYNYMASNTPLVDFRFRTERLRNLLPNIEQTIYADAHGSEEHNKEDDDAPGYKATFSFSFFGA